MIDAAMTAHPIKIDVVVPTLNAGEHLGRCLQCLQDARKDGLIGEVVVVDGGSTDGTAEAARACGATVVSSARGRGLQLARGALAASAPWLLFLHADTRLLPGWERETAAFIRQGDGRAAAFRLGFDDSARAARRLERAAAWRVRRFGLAYGDQGLLISRRLYDEVGGYRDMPLMEDVDLVRRLGKRRLMLLESVAETSAARYRRDGYLRRSARNLALLTLYYCGMPVRVLARLYG